MRSRFSGNEQDNPHPLRYRLFQRAVQPRIGTVQSATMQIDADVGNYNTFTNPAVPATVKVVRRG